MKIPVFNKFRTISIPSSAFAAMTWGALFLLNGPSRRVSPGFRTLLLWFPFWVLGVMMMVTGILVLATRAEWALACLVAVIFLYVITLVCNIFITPSASLTGWVWPMATVVNLVASGARFPIRRSE